MATITERFGFTKPAGSDPASIVPLNSNTDLIEQYLGRTQDMIAPMYDDTATYDVGDIVTYESNLYKCITAISTAETFDPTKWTRTTAGEESGGGADLDIYGEASGTAEASFSDGAEASLVKCIVEIEATQSGSGTPSPSNIRPISGHTDVTVTVASTSGGSGEDTTVSLGRTVYGGTLDVTTGKLTVTHELVTAPTRGSLDSSGKLYTLVFSPSIRIKSWEQTKIPSAYIVSNMFEVEELVEARESKDKCLVQYGMAIYAGGYIGEESALDTLLATLQIKYELATPQTFNLTPTQVETLLGQNYVSHDGGGTISLVYIKKDSIIIPNPSDAEVPLTGLEISGKDFVITDARIPAPPTTNGAYVLTVTVSGGTPTYSWENA